MTGEIKKCKKNCLTCETKENNCLSCIPNRIMPNCGCPPPYENKDPEGTCGSKQFIKSIIYSENDLDRAHDVLSIMILIIIIMDFVINIISNYYLFTKVFRL